MNFSIFVIRRHVYFFHHHSSFPARRPMRRTPRVPPVSRPSKNVRIFICFVPQFFFVTVSGVGFAAFPGIQKIMTNPGRVGIAVGYVPQMGAAFTGWTVQGLPPPISSQS